MQELGGTHHRNNRGMTSKKHTRFKRLIKKETDVMVDRDRRTGGCLCPVLYAGA